MNCNNDLYSKFPTILRNKLSNNELCFPKHTEYEYEKILAYRCVEREKEDYTPINRIDFYSNIEEFKIKGKKSRKDVDKQQTLKKIFFIMLLHYIKTKVS